MTDYAALRAYEAAFQFYRAEARGGTPQAPSLSGLDGEIFQAVSAMCEFRLGRGQNQESLPEGASPIALENLLDALRKLIKSVERHTKHGGRQGYLTFIDEFLP